MLHSFLEQLCREIDASMPKLNEHKLFPLKVGEDIVALKDLGPGVGMQAQICPCPSRKKEDLFIWLMRANLLGQGTGGARIGLDSDEKFLTLSLGLPYEMSYQIFKDNLEDFVNYLNFWRGEVTKFESEEQLY